MHGVCRRQAGQYKVDVTVANPLSSASQLLVVEVVNVLYRLTLSGSPVVGAVHSVRTFSIGMLDFGPNSCIKVDYGDDSAAEFYGPDRFVNFHFVFILLCKISLSDYRIGNKQF